MIGAGLVLLGIGIGVGVTFLVARNNQKHVNRALNADKDLKRRLKAAVKAARSS
jgi:demethoxyubiquinone hydroxylase (CLK1/Coq7/Cat5 family)